MTTSLRRPLFGSIRLDRRNRRDGGISFTICSSSSRVGFFRAMSNNRVRSRALLRGRTWSTNTKVTADSRAPATITGVSNWVALIPLARMAVISLSADSWLKV